MSSQPPLDVSKPSDLLDVAFSNDIEMLLKCTKAVKNSKVPCFGSIQWIRQSQNALRFIQNVELAQFCKASRKIMIFKIPKNNVLQTSSSDFSAYVMKIVLHYAVQVLQSLISFEWVFIYLFPPC